MDTQVGVRERERRDDQSLSWSQVAGSQGVARPWPRLASVYLSLYVPQLRSPPDLGVRGSLGLPKEPRSAPCKPQVLSPRL